MAEKLWQDKDWLNKMYWEQGKSLSEMAKLASCGIHTLHYWMTKFNIPRRPLAEANRLRYQNPEYRKRHARSVSQANRRKAQDPLWQRKHANAMRQVTQTPEWRRKNAEAARRKARNPKWQQRHAKFLRQLQHRLALKKRRQGEMTDIEAIIYNALRALGLKEGKDFDFEVPTKGGYTADFLIYSHNIVLEAYGRYWHTLPGKQEYDAKRKQFLEACGHIVLEWWGPDIKADVWKLIDDQLLPLLNEPSRIERPPRGVFKPYKGPNGWESALQLNLFDQDD